MYYAYSNSKALLYYFYLIKLLCSTDARAAPWLLIIFVSMKLLVGIRSSCIVTEVLPVEDEAR